MKSTVQTDAGSLTTPIPQKLDQQPYTKPGCPWRRVSLAVLVISHPGDVQVRPGITGERLEKDGRSAHAAKASAAVLDIGHIRFDGLIVVIPQGERPHAFMRRRPRRHQLLPQPIFRTKE